MRNHLLLLLTIPLLLASACGTLNKEGAYHGDKVLYDADMVISTSYTLVHEFVKWEFDNRAVLSKTPQVKEYADSIRLQYPLWHRTAMAARTAYVGAPTDVNRTALQQALDVLRECVRQANQWIAFGAQNTAATL